MFNTLDVLVNMTICTKRFQPIETMQTVRLKFILKIQILPVVSTVVVSSGVAVTTAVVSWTVVVAWAVVVGPSVVVTRVVVASVVVGAPIYFRVKGRGKDLTVNRFPPQNQHSQEFSRTFPQHLS